MEQAATPAPDRALSDKEVSRLTGLSRTTRWRLRRRGEFPAPRQLAPATFRYLESDVVTWLRSRPAVVPEYPIRTKPAGENA